MAVIGAFLTGFVAFSVTNLDDLFVLMAWFSQSRSEIRKPHIIFGQYLGFLTLIVSSLFVSFGKFLIPSHWIGLLGFLPIYMAIKEFMELLKDKNLSRHEKMDISALAQAEKNNKSLVGVFLNVNSYKVASVTIANGADNIGVYTPLFASSSFEQLFIITAVFLLMVGIWIFIALKLIRHPLIAETAGRYGNILLPFILFGLGIYIIASTGTLTYIFSS